MPIIKNRGDNIMEEYSVEERIHALVNQVYIKAPVGTVVNEKNLSKLEDIFQFFVEMSVNEENLVYEGNETFLYFAVGEEHELGYPLTIVYEIFEFSSEILMTENFCYLLCNCIDACTIRPSADSDNITIEICLNNIYTKRLTSRS